MDTGFVGRGKDLGFLERAYAAKGSAFIPIYGRRRVGKSRLIMEFLKGKQTIYYVGKKSSTGLQVKEFLSEAATALRQPLLAELSTDDWRGALQAVLSQWKGAGKLVVALDEFQWMAQKSPEIISVIQELWDRQWRDAGNVFLILCGSYIGFMEKEVLGRNSPLFGRRTGQILLQPFDYREAAQFHTGYSIQDRARVWFLCGGVPLYLRSFSPHRSIEMNIRDLFLDENAPLFREADFLLREELREVESYYAVLTALATGACTAADIARRSFIEERVLSYYLNNLINLGYVARRFPLVGPKPPLRKVHYVVADPLLKFWARFVYPHVSRIALLGPQAAFQHLIKKDLESYFGGCFESLCKDAMPFLYKSAGVDADFTIGEYWDKNVQIDVVGYRSDNFTDLGECKWGTVKSLTAVAIELVNRIPLYPNKRNATIKPRMFLRDRPKRPTADSLVAVHSLDDFYE